MEDRSILEHYQASASRPPMKHKQIQPGNIVPQELVLNLLAQGYPLEELLEFFPMFTLDQLLLLIEDDYIH